MAENLNIQTADSWCFLNRPDSCAKYGRLYTWDAAIKACPSGWHLSTREEWGILVRYAGGTGTHGEGDGGSPAKKLNATSGWEWYEEEHNDSINYNGTDDFGFSALPGGYRHSNGGWWNGGISGTWWTATEEESEYRGIRAYYRDIGTNDGVGVTEGGGKKLNALSVRCVKNEPGNNTWNNTCTSAEKCKKVTIGTQTWMAENLNVETTDSWCYKDSASYCNKYGRLYTWEAAKTACPLGWHLPTPHEWQTLVDYAGGNFVAGSKLKSTRDWYVNGGGTDVYGFSALPGGYRTSGSGDFFNARYDGIWWTTDRRSGEAHSRDMYYNQDSVNGNDRGNGDDGFSVRCVKN
jgi:uncharacterized protein (TIGR02145 family)